MLNVTLDMNDYIMIGEDIRIQYRKNKGENSFTVVITAPDGVNVLRGDIFEEEVEKLAMEGDIEAQITSDILAEDKMLRKQMAGVNRAKLAHIRKNNAKVMAKAANGVQ